MKSGTSFNQMVDMLEHLVRFQLTKDLGNQSPESSFEESFNISIIADGLSITTSHPITMRDGSLAELVVENKGAKNLYALIYNLGPQWQIENAYRATYAVASVRDGSRFSGHTVKRKLRMTIPTLMKESGHRTCDDILEVFVTSHPTSFESLELPKLNEIATSRNEAIQWRHHDDYIKESWTMRNFPIRIMLLDI